MTEREGGRERERERGRGREGQTDRQIVLERDTRSTVISAWNIFKTIKVIRGVLSFQLARLALMKSVYLG